MKYKHLVTLFASFFSGMVGAYAQPANDECPNATLINLSVNSCGTPINGTTQQASASNPPVADQCSDGTGQDVWYKFVPQTSGVVNLRITKDAPGSNLYAAIYKGDCANLTFVYCTNDLGFDIEQIVVQQTVYYIKIFEQDANQHINFTVCGFMVDNDECTSAKTIDVSNDYCTHYTIGTTKLATQSFTTPLPCGNVNDNNDDVWYRFVAPSAGNLYINTFPYNHTIDQLTVQVYKGNCNSLVAEQCNTSTDAKPNYIVVNSTAPGAEYYLRIFTPTNDPAKHADLQICIFTGSPPPNDNCTNATVIPVTDNVCNQPSWFNTLAATASGGVAPSCEPTGADDDIWATFAATRDGTIKVALLNNLNDNAAGVVLQFYTGLDCGGLTSVQCGNYPSNDNFEFTVTAGTKYYIRAFSPENSPANFASFGLCANYLPPVPLNNDCAGAVTVAVSNNASCAGAVNGTTFGATETLAGCQGTADDDVWFKFIATATEQFFKVTPANTNGISDVVFEVFSGTCENLVTKSCVNSTTDALAEESLLSGFTIGETYFIRVYSHSSEAISRGDFAICIAQSNSAITNLLANPSFEAPEQTIIGNNFLDNKTDIRNWTLSLQPNLVKVDGSDYSGGPNSAHHGLQYLDLLTGNGTADQKFSLTTPASIQFGGWFSRREPTAGTGFDGKVEILDANGITLATSAIANFTQSESEERWKGVTGTIPLQPGTYTFRFNIHDYANVDDAFVTIIDPTVASVTITANASSICPNANVVFTATVVNGGAAPEFVWKKNNVAIENSNAAIYNDNTLLATDRITCQLTSNDPMVIVPNVTSDGISIAIDPDCYCIPFYRNGPSSITISNVTVNGVSKNSGSSALDGYNDFSQIVFPARQSELSNFSVTSDNTFLISQVWIDFNDDKDFEDAGESVFVKKKVGLKIVIGSFFIPGNAPLGDHRIRFSANFGSARTTSCESGSGETEDYTINIAPPNACNGSPVAALAKADQYVLCSGDSTTLTVYANGLGIGYQWQKSGTPNSGFTNINGATTSTYATKELTTDTYFRCMLTCTGLSAPSPVLAILMGSVPANDNICNAIPVSHEVFNYQNTTCATVHGENYPHPLECSTPNNTVWYKITPSITERLRLKVNKVPNDPYPVDAWVNIFTSGGSCGNLVLTPVSPYPFNCLRANLPNDSSATIEAGGGGDPLHPSGILKAGTTYYIRVDGFRDSYGAFGIISLTPTKTIIWSGGMNSTWENPANWSGGILPGPDNDVIIAGNLANYPVVNSDVSIKSLTLNPGATYTVNTGHLKIVGN